jgi:hypothetical protein
MAEENKLFSFQGYVYIGERGSAGKIINPVWVGDATMQVAMEVQTAEHNESFSGQRLPYGLMQTSKKANVTLTLWEMRSQVLALALYANRVTTSPGTVTGEVMDADLGAGQATVLAHPLVSNLVITDSASMPTTLAEGVNYSLENPTGGLVRIIDPGSFIQPFKAAYSYAGVDDVLIFTSNPPERWVQMVGVNTLNDQPVIVDLYRVKFNPSSQLPLHNNEFGSFELTGSALADALLASNSNLGGFGRVRLPAEA